MNTHYIFDTERRIIVAVGNRADMETDAEDLNARYAERFIVKEA